MGSRAPRSGGLITELEGNPVTSLPDHAAAATKLFPTLGNVRGKWEREFDPDDDSAEDHMQKLLERFEILSNQFCDDEEAVAILSEETKRAREWVVSYTPDEPPKGDRSLGDVKTSAANPSSKRSIFDDIDV
jgi:hypothetical protein